MVDNTILRTLPIGEISDGAKMHKAAIAAGLAQAQIDQIIAQELADHGNPSYTWFKGKVLGAAFAVVMPVMAIHLLWTGELVWKNAIFMMTLSVAGLWFSRYSDKQQKLSALSAAVLRSHAQDLTRAQISALKDDPIVSKDSDAKALLSDIQSALPA